MSYLVIAKWKINTTNYTAAENEQHTSVYCVKNLTVKIIALLNKLLSLD